MTGWLIALLAGAIIAPPLLGLRRASPGIAITLWLCSLALRALTVALLAIYILLYLPQTALFASVTHWCWHTVLPLLTTRVGVDGHYVGDAATVVPSVLVAASIVWGAFSVARAASSVRAWLRGGGVGSGPGDSIVVAGRDVLLAAAGLLRPRVVVSVGALTQLDDDELAAGIDHERGHIARRHRYVALAAELARGMARTLPGTRRAMRELRLHLERDADRWALRRRHDPLALASAICKTALSRAPGSVAVFGLSDSGRLGARVSEITDSASRRRGADALLGVLAIASVAVTTALSVAVPIATAVGLEQLAHFHEIHHCKHS